ncbi:MAG: hypothetical protein RLZZ459_452 [Cyanobacteriota bacterium]
MLAEPVRRAAQPINGDWALDPLLSASQPGIAARQRQGPAIHQSAAFLLEARAAFWTALNGRIHGIPALKLRRRGCDRRSPAASQTVPGLPQYRKAVSTGLFQDSLQRKGSRVLRLFLITRARGAQPFRTRAKTSPTRESRSTLQTLKHCFRVALEIDTTTSGSNWLKTPSVLIELMGALARGGTPGHSRATRGVPGFSQRKGPGNLTSLGLPLKGAGFYQQFHGDPSNASFTLSATHLSN